MVRLSLLALALLRNGVSAVSPGGVSEERAIRDARAFSNRAIAARDLSAYTATITRDFVITTGSGVSYSRAEFLELWTKQFADPHWQGCVRTTDKVEISASQPAAAESGRFVCRSTDPAKPSAYRGTYTAMWRKEEGHWRTRAELFVTLSCEGEGCAAPKR
jgi:ketosteroid isomerase-like protein